MTLRIQNLSGQIGAEIQEIDLSRSLLSQTLAEIKAAIDRYAIVVIRNQTLSGDDQISFARNFGDLETSNAAVLSKRSRLTQPELVDISNIATADGKLKSADDPGRVQSMVNYLWHCDASSKPIQGALSMLFAQVIPASGSRTEFCDLRAAYDDLPDDLRRKVDGLRAMHDYARMQEILGFTNLEAMRETWPPIARPLTTVHAGSGRGTLYLSSAAASIVGMSLAEGRLLLLDLMMHSTRKDHVYEHHWREGDFVIWDNRCTMHRARAYDETQMRDLRRVTTVTHEKMMLPA